MHIVDIRRLYLLSALRSLAMLMSLSVADGTLLLNLDRSSLGKLVIFIAVVRLVNGSHTPCL